MSPWPIHERCWACSARRRWRYDRPRSKPIRRTCNLVNLVEKATGAVILEKRGAWFRCGASRCGLARQGSPGRSWADAANGGPGAPPCCLAHPGRPLRARLSCSHFFFLILTAWTELALDLGGFKRAVRLQGCVHDADRRVPRVSRRSTKQLG